MADHVWTQITIGGELDREGIDALIEALFDDFHGNDQSPDEVLLEAVRNNAQFIFPGPMLRRSGYHGRQTLIHLERVNVILIEWGWPPINVCRKVPLASTGYTDLYGNCVANEGCPLQV